MEIVADLLSGALLLAAIASRIQAGRHARAANDDTDELYHLSYIELLRARGHRLPSRFPQFLGPGRNTYPAGYHWALSFLPQRAADAIGRYGALVGDMLLGASASVLLGLKADLPVAAAIAALALYLASPALTLVNIGPRSFHLTPRLPSQLLFGAICMTVVAAGGRLSLGLAVLVAALLAMDLLMSKFALQAAVLSIPALAVWAGPLEVLGIFFGACALAAVASGGFFLWQVRGQAEHLEWYVKRQLPHMYRGMAWSELIGAIRARKPLDAARIVIFKNPLTAGVIRHVHVLAAAIWLLVDQPDLSAAQDAALAFTAAGLTGWVLTSGGPFRILGEAERYLEFVFPASWFLLWSLPHGTGALLAVVLLMTAYEAAMHAGNIAIMRGRSAAVEKAKADRNAVLRALGERDSATVLFLDVKDAFAVQTLHEGVRTVMFNGGQASLRGDMAGFLDWFFMRYPFVHPGNLDEIVGRYGVDVIVARDFAVEQARAEDGRGYDLERFRQLFENGSYRVFAVD